MTEVTVTVAILTVVILTVLILTVVTSVVTVTVVTKGSRKKTAAKTQLNREQILSHVIGLCQTCLFVFAGLQHLCQDEFILRGSGQLGPLAVTVVPL